MLQRAPPAPARLLVLQAEGFRGVPAVHAPKTRSCAPQRGLERPLTLEENRRAFYRPRAAPPAAAAWRGLALGANGDGVPFAGRPLLRPADAGALPADAHAASVARFTAGLPAGLRELVRARAAAGAPLPVPAAPQPAAAAAPAVPARGAAPASSPPPGRALPASALAHAAPAPARAPQPATGAAVALAAASAAPAAPATAGAAAGAGWAGAQPSAALASGWGSGVAHPGGGAALPGAGTGAAGGPGLSRLGHPAAAPGSAGTPGPAAPAGPGSQPAAAAAAQEASRLRIPVPALQDWSLALPAAADAVGGRGPPHGALGGSAPRPAALPEASANGSTGTHAGQWAG